ncbi:hypothetical protein BS78_05G273900 [Paspalum vaginatum]|nr:hypothetical protein BS78_05G273900 [Paspalum vaginatum]
MAAARAWFILALVVAAVVVEGGAARPPSMTQQQRQQVESLLRRLNKPPLATIQSPDGDIIDCVHISKQPAFDHPLLKNHTIQMRPFSYPRDLHNASNIAPQPISQTWHQNGRCPENTIPIRRTKEEDVLRASSISMFGKKRPGSIPNHNSFEQSVTSGHEWATASSSADRYYGTKATFNLWQPNIERSGDFSLTQLWIIKGSYSGNDLNTIEAGWQVYPGMYGDRNPRLFIYWTRDAYQKTGCYNLCAGFVQTNNQIAIGGSLTPVSTYGGSQYEFSILIWKVKYSLHILGIQNQFYQCAQGIYIYIYSQGVE